MKFILTLFCLAFFFANDKAFLFISIAVISKVGFSNFKIILMQPEPVPISRTEELLSFNLSIYFNDF